MTVANWFAAGFLGGILLFFILAYLGVIDRWCNSWR